MGLQQFEQRLERLVEGVFAKAFRSGVQPVELGRRLIREMDLRRTVGIRGVMAPNRFTISVGADDRERLAAIEQTLLRELVDAARDHARTESYKLAGPIEVTMATAPGLGKGSFRVWAELAEGSPTAAVVMADGTRIDVGDEPVSLGRASDCSIVLADPTVSKRHAELRREGTDVVVVDLGSTNGTKVNGAGVRERALRDGDEIHIGATVLHFEAS
jgi:hypothetical protein